jgi:hypothetical protein
VEMSKQNEPLASSPEAILIDVKQGDIDLPTLLTICVDLLSVCAKRSAEIDPAVAAMVAYARDEILEHANNDRFAGLFGRDDRELAN